MSEKTASTPETTKPSKLSVKLNSLKPSNIDNEKKEAAVRRIKFATAYTLAFVAGALTTVAVMNAKNLHDAETEETAEVEETEETTED
jgi:hypothetical protein